MLSTDEGGLRELLVRQALALLEDTGEVPSLRAVARAAGVSAMTPYSYFADKASLMGAVADRGFAAMAARLEAADDRADSVEALVAQGVAYVGFATENPALFRLIYSHEYGHARSASAGRSYDVLEARVASLIPSKVSAGILACRALVQGMATIILDGRLVRSGPGDVEAAIRLLVHGFVAVQARS